MVGQSVPLHTQAHAFQAAMNSSVLSPDADTALPQQETQQASTSKAKQKQKPMWRGPDYVTWDPNPSAVRPPLFTRMP